MRVAVKAERGLDLRPPVAEKLKRLPTERLHHSRLQLRHPAGVYHVSLERLAGRFEAALAPLEVLQSSYAPTSEPHELDDVMENTEALLRSVAEHLEDCKNILLALFPSSGAAKSSAEFRQFGSEVEPYRDRVGRIVNAIKHRGERVRPVFMHWGPDFAPGYFIEGMLEDGILGPDPNIHTGSDTAISLFRDGSFKHCPVL